MPYASLENRSRNVMLVFSPFRAQVGSGRFFIPATDVCVICRIYGPLQLCVGEEFWT
jgi:hypothetical protein